MKEEKLQEAKRLYETANADQRYVLESLFPELRESEDERIKNLIYCLIRDRSDNRELLEHNGIMIEKALAWLEKQGEQKPTIEMKSAEESLGIDSDTYNEIVDECIYGEQKSQRMISAEAKEAMYDKPADKVEPKFKVGDSIKTANEEPLTITEITDNGYWSEDLFICNFDDAAKWELVEQKPVNTVEQKCEESKTKIFDAPTPFEDKLYAFVLACEILVDPSKREFILEHSQEILDAAREQIGKEQSSTWSEKDEEMRLAVLQDLQNIKESYPNVNVEPEFNWLKSLKERCPWKPSDEQMKALHDLNLTGNISYAGQGQTLIELYNDLKKLKGE